ncbi:hypothetical protein HWV62_32365 [Athelia sp. TMB]|nr:hypothetical protein HWV62_32365 [Athelia sp. TMB]
MARGSPGTGPMDHVDIALREILTPQQINLLLQSFEEQFSPWLNLPRHDPHRGNAFLRLAKCLIASRLLDPAIRASVAPRLRELTEKTMGSILFNPVPSTDSILAMIVLALWNTVGDGSAVARDERLIIAAAVSMAINLHLNDAVEYLSRIKNLASDGAPDAAVENEDQRDKARLWLCLTNVESMLCIGTGRFPLSSRSKSDCDVIEWSPALCSTLESGRDVRLGLSGKIYATAEAGLRLRLEKPEDLESFYLKSADIFAEMDTLGNFITPLSGIRNNFGHATGWHRKAIYNGISLPRSWGKQTLLLAQDVLTSAISKFEHSTELSMIPDSIFAMVCSTAALLIRIKTLAYVFVGVRIIGSSDKLLQRTREIFASAACAPDHLPAQCAQFIASLIDSYETRLREPFQRQPADEIHTEGSLQRGVPHPTTEGLPTLPSLDPPGDDHGPSNPGVSRDDEVEAGMGFGLGIADILRGDSDWMLDSDFWASFMDNLTTDIQM